MSSASELIPSKFCLRPECAAFTASLHPLLPVSVKAVKDLSVLLFNPQICSVRRPRKIKYSVGVDQFLRSDRDPNF